MNTHKHTTPALNTSQSVRPVCPFCGGDMKLVSCYQGGRGYVSTMVCAERWASDDDVCGKEAGK